MLASYGSRGDIEPCAAVARELQARGHDVQLAVPPDLIPLVESVGLEAVPYGIDSRKPLEAQRRMHTSRGGVRNVTEAVVSGREASRHLTRVWSEAGPTLRRLCRGADVIFTGLFFEQITANVAEHYDIPLVAMHYTPVRPNGQLALGRRRPPALVLGAMTSYNWAWFLQTMNLDNAQRRALGMPMANRPVSQRIADRGWLEIQAYDEPVFPGLSDEWSQHGDRRPFVGGLTLELPAEADDEVLAWIADGDPPIYFGFGSVPLGSPVDTYSMITNVCAQLGQRALICAGGTSFDDVRGADDVKVVSAVNHATVFPACRAVVHGGTGATTAGLRAGVPAVVLWTLLGQRIWGAQLEMLKLGATRRLSTVTRRTLFDDLSRVLEPECAQRAGAFAHRMTRAPDSAAHAADLVERSAGHSCQAFGRGA
ncbi:hypothetical protein MCNF_49030 [Mycolicibacterium confluentis]|uniref:Glycosyltransferase family 28 N-terminal domain-containing protein n=1 Tax=Mycolicibacterium confluentis TaxID=28047 RepID=A0A7I7Y3S4_9MYCO|nr:hypothetical protein MCNF_49030 [Mycolicibacterium confluentis]